MELIESGLKFAFKEGIEAIKYDETEYYRREFIKQPDAKGVDFLAYNSKLFVMVEVKNCTGDESNNRWRIAPNNEKVQTAHTSYDVSGRESLDIEVAKKVAMTVAALCGVFSYGNKRKSAERLNEYSKGLFSQQYASDKKKLLVMLFLEGDFATKTRTEKMVLRQLQIFLKKKLGWLNCDISVVNSNTYPTRLLGDVRKETISR